MRKTIPLLLLIIFSAGMSYAQCFSKVSVGDSFNLAIKSDGSLWSWGSNRYGELGNGTDGWDAEFDVLSPTQVGNSYDWESISAGEDHCLAIKNDGTLWAWGRNIAGYLGLGIGTPGIINTPTQIGTDITWETISAGDSYSLAIKTDGTLWAWGQNSYGRLGIGGTTSVNLPTQVGTLSNWQKIEAGYNFSLAIKSDGSLWSWGHNGSGNLGNGIPGEVHIPTQVGSDTNWVKITSGVSHSLAIKNNGTLWAWGNNTNRQFGNGTTVSSSVPVQSGNDTTWQDVDSFDFACMGIKSDGSLWGWGNNGNGQLGNGGLLVTIPVQVTSSNWKSVGMGGAHAVGLQNNGNLLAWGYNSSGELGNGNANNGVTTPISINVCPLSISDFNTISVMVYPIPTNGEVTVVSKNTIKRIEVYDLNARLITAVNEDSETVSVNMEPFVTGIYFLKIIASEGYSIQKVLKN